MWDFFFLPWRFLLARSLYVSNITIITYVINDFHYSTCQCDYNIVNNNVEASGLASLWYFTFNYYVLGRLEEINSNILLVKCPVLSGSTCLWLRLCNLCNNIPARRVGLLHCLWDWFQGQTGQWTGIDFHLMSISSTRHITTTIITTSGVSAWYHTKLKTKKEERVLDKTYTNVQYNKIIIGTYSGAKFCHHH